MFFPDISKEDRVRRTTKQCRWGRVIVITSYSRLPSYLILFKKMRVDESNLHTTNRMRRQ